MNANCPIFVIILSIRLEGEGSDRGRSLSPDDTKKVLNSRLITGSKTDVDGVMNPEADNHPDKPNNDTNTWDTIASSAIS